ncbi:MAG TPA: reverse transcriptase domain-containing protein [Thiotrichales bacterium]|nr:reverse transcriptase domain-containing protein [Thiotrichales bacterium]
MSSSGFMDLITLSDLAYKLTLSRDDLIALSERDESDAYHRFKLKKKRGGYRILQAPDAQLLAAQQRINYWLTTEIKEYASQFAHGFMPERSIVTNAQEHLGKAWVLNMDLENFFGSFGYEQVKQLFLSAPFEFDTPVAEYAAKLCTSSEGLPQGAPTSPSLSNWLMRELDGQLLALARKHKLSYTRYADDITFSSNRSIPGELLRKDLKTGAWQLSDQLHQLFAEHGLKVNPRKTRLQTQHQRQEVTGLTVNQRINVDRRYVRNLRGMIHAYKKYGYFAVMKYNKTLVDDASGSSNDIQHFLSVIAGKLGFIAMVKGQFDPVVMKLKEDFEQAKTARKTLLENRDN